MSEIQCCTMFAVPLDEFKSKREQTICLYLSTRFTIKPN